MLFCEKGSFMYVSSTALSSTEKSRTSPRFCRSSWIVAMPASIVSRVVLFSILFPLMRMVPLSTLIRFVIASTSSFCPLPSIPAMPKISPRLTCMDRFLSTYTPQLSFAVSPLTSNTTSPGFASSLSTTSFTRCPTIMSASSSWDTLATSTVSMYFPLRMMLQ